MAVRELRAEPATIERIQRHRKPRKPSPASRESIAAVREIVRESDSVEGAIGAVKAIDSAWANRSDGTRSSIGLLLAILELSTTIDEALATFAMLKADGSLLKPLTEIRAFVETEFPDARMRIVPGDEVSSAYLDVRIPTEDYPSFWASYVRLRDWVVENMTGLSGIIQLVPRPARATHV